MWLRVLLVLVAVACVIDVGEALFKTQRSRETKDYMKRVREFELQSKKHEAQKRNATSWESSKDSSDYDYYDYSWNWTPPPQCPLYECYWGDCWNFTTCMEAAKESEHFCLCTLGDVIRSKGPDACMDYDYYYAWDSRPDFSARNCSGCLSAMDRVGFYGDDEVAYDCKKKEDLDQLRQCFADSEDGDQCLRNRFGMDADFVFEGIEMQIDGCPMNEIHWTCLDKLNIEYQASELSCQDREANSKVEEMKACSREEAAKIDACNIDAHKELLEAAGDAMRELGDRMCGEREAAVAEKQSLCGCGQQSVKAHLRKTLRQLINKLS